jgi:hypothetical protein
MGHKRPWGVVMAGVDRAYPVEKKEHLMLGPSPGDQIEFTFDDGKKVVTKVVNVAPGMTLEVPSDSGNLIQIEQIGPFKSYRVIPQNLRGLL